MQFLTIKQVSEKVALSRTSIYRGLVEGTFPAQYFLGARAVRWLDEEIDAWMQAIREGKSEPEIKELVKSLKDARTKPRSAS